MHIHVHARRRREGGEHGVVVACREGIELVIVAACAAHGEAEHGAAGGAEHVVHGVVTCALDFVRGDLRWEDSCAEKSRRREGERILGLVFVAGELPLHELVVGHVHVQRLDDEIAKVEGVGAVVVLLESGAFRVACHIEPVACPALAVGRGGEQFVDLIGEIGLVRRIRGEAGEVQGEPACESGLVRRRIEGHALRVLQEQLVDGLCLHLLQRLKGPPLAIFVGDDAGVAFRLLA